MENFDRQKSTFVINKLLSSIQELMLSQVQEIRNPAREYSQKEIDILKGNLQVCITITNIIKEILSELIDADSAVLSCGFAVDRDYLLIGEKGNVVCIAYELITDTITLN